MSTTTPNFGLVIATTADVVSVSSHVAGPFTSLDSIISVGHTGTGQHKAGISFTTPTLTNPTLVGTMQGGTIIATEGFFQTLTATAGPVVFTSITIGTYNLPTTVGSTGQVLTVQTGNAVWLTNSPSTGANEELSNLTTVAINTSLNTFTAGFVTVSRIIATSGSLTGLTAFQSTTGTFTNVTVAGTVGAQAVNCTGGTVTAGSFSIGTYSYPTTVGSTGQVLSVTTGNARWLTRTADVVYFRAYATAAQGGAGVRNLIFGGESFDAQGVFTAAATATQFTVSASGYYLLGCNVFLGTAATNSLINLYISTSAGHETFVLSGLRADGTGVSRAIGGSVLVLATSGDKFGVVINGTGNIGSGEGVSYFYGMKVPDTLAI